MTPLGHRASSGPVLILLGIAFCALLPAQSTGTEAEPLESATLRLDVPAEAFEHDRQDWYGIYANDDKLGYLKLSIHFESADEDRFVVENEMHLKVITLGQKRQIRSVETMTFEGTAPYRLRSGRSVIDQGPFTQQVELEMHGDHYEARIIAANSERTLDVVDPDFTVADVLTPELWFREPRHPGDRLSTRSFSLTDLESAIDTYSIRQLKDTLVDGVNVGYYEVELHSTAAGSIGTALIDQGGTLVSGVIGGAFEIRLETAELAQDFDYSADVYLLGMAGIDAPLGDPSRVISLLLEVEGEAADRIPQSARQRLFFDEDSASWRLALGEDAEGEPVLATPTAVEEALAESVEHPIRDERIRRMAREAVGDVTDTRGQIEALVRFVDSYLADSYSAEPLTVLDMLTTRKGDCTEHALLFTTLARALGIPTREVTGLLYLGDDVQAFGGHAWNEVALDGFWQAVDPTWGEVEVNATHILLGPRVGDDASADALFGGYTFKLIDVDRDDPDGSL